MDGSRDTGEMVKVLPGGLKFGSALGVGGAGCVLCLLSWSKRPNSVCPWIHDAEPMLSKPISCAHTCEFRIPWKIFQTQVFKITRAD